MLEVDKTNGRFSILIVDDSKSIVKAIQEEAEFEGFDTMSAFDGEEALEVLNHSEFDLVICDIKMPNLDGFQLYKKAKKIKKRPPQFVFFSAYSELTNRELKNEGAICLIKKPEFEELFDIIINLFKERKAIDSDWSDPL